MTARELPILFSGPMVRAILEGRKTQTRRLCKPMRGGRLPDEGGDWHYEHDANGFGALVRREPLGVSTYPLPRAPYGVAGDRLWVREAWARRLDEDRYAPRDLDPQHGAWYWADPQTCNTGCAGAAGKKRPGIHMPRWASRITLEVTGVRVERLNDISEEDAKAEGVSVSHRATAPGEEGRSCVNCGRRRDAHIGQVHVCPQSHGSSYSTWTYRGGYAVLWDSINADRAPWASNPWVWAVSWPALKNIRPDPRTTPKGGGARD